MTRGALAYAHARMRAVKSRLFTRSDVLPLLTAPDPPGVRRALAALGLEGDAPLQRLLRVYRTAIRVYPEHAEVFRAMLRRHEIENVKLVWRTIANHRERNDRLWLELGDLATVSRSLFDAATLRDLATRLAKTPYGAIAMKVFKAHANDLAAAEAAFDSVGQALMPVPPARGQARVPVLHVFRIDAAIETIRLAESEYRGVNALIERGGDPSFDDVVQRVLARGRMGA